MGPHSAIAGFSLQVKNVCRTTAFQTLVHKHERCLFPLLAIRARLCGHNRCSHQGLSSRQKLLMGLCFPWQPVLQGVEMQPPGPIIEKERGQVRIEAGERPSHFCTACTCCCDNSLLHDCQSLDKRPKLSFPGLPHNLAQGNYTTTRLVQIMAKLRTLTFIHSLIELENRLSYT